MFRGDTRLAIPLAIIAEIQAHEGRLSFKAGGRQLVLELGASAEKWAKRMTSPPSRIDKLGVKAGMRVGPGRARRSGAGRGHRIPRRGNRIERRGAAGLDMIFFAAHALARSRSARGARRADPAGGRDLAGAREGDSGANPGVGVDGRRQARRPRRREGRELLETATAPRNTSFPSPIDRRPPKARRAIPTARPRAPSLPVDANCRHLLCSSDRAIGVDRRRRRRHRHSASEQNRHL